MRIQITTGFMLLLGFGLLSGNLTAQAQLGIGFGMGNGYWGGPGIWGNGFGNRGFGGFYGMGVTIAPGHYTSHLPQSDLQNTNRNQNPSSPAPGYLDGYVAVCAPSPQTSSTSAVQPVPAAKTQKPPSGLAASPAKPPAKATLTGARCTSNPEALPSVAIVASPYGVEQWIGTKPDSRGHFRLTLMPGGYLVQPSSPQVQNQRPIEVIIEPGQTTHQNFQLGP